VINKIDLKSANITRVKEELKKLMDIDPSEVICVSAKHGTNIEDILKVRLLECVVTNFWHGFVIVDVLFSKRS